MPRHTLLIPQRHTENHHRFGKLPKWKADLLWHMIVYHQHTHLLAHNGATIVVSDGGIEGGKGYFGVVIAVGAILLARGKGVARGDPHTMCFFRAEGYGFLAGISLLPSILKMIYKSAWEMHQIHTDSASLLARLATALSSHIPVGLWLKTDSDLVMQIADEARGFTNLERHYVKGHQYSIERPADLTQQERYNIEADASATEMLHAMMQPASES
jgi:hypothetical protein